MKPSGFGLLFVGIFFVTFLISVLVIGLFKFSISPSFEKKKKKTLVLNFAVLGWCSLFSAKKFFYRMHSWRII